VGPNETYILLLQFCSHTQENIPSAAKRCSDSQASTLLRGWTSLHICLVHQVHYTLSRTNHIGWRAINKPSEDENRWLSGERTRATLHISHVTQPPHKSMACKTSSQAQLTSVHVPTLRDGWWKKNLILKLVTSVLAGKPKRIHFFSQEPLFLLLFSSYPK
jgi:hypothetical protein